MIKRIGFVSILVLLPTIVLAEVQDLKTNNGGAGITTAPNESALGTGMKVDNDFNANSVQKAFDNSKPSENIKNFNYDPNKIVKVRLRLNMNTLIVLPSDEEIDAFVLADSYAFTATPLSEKKTMLNMINLKGMVAGTDTNFKVIGKSGKIYNFYLRTDPVTSAYVPDFTIYIHAAPENFFFQRGIEDNAMGKKVTDILPPPYPAANILDLQSAKVDYLKSLPDPVHANINYRMTGDFEIAPTGVYDDDQWTYFDFRKKLPSDRLPVIYKVVDGIDTLINTRMEKGFLIAESISKEGWSLRNGGKTVCIRPAK